ncbi:hypothetical protein OROMI_006450 [Orobanche minor]
MAKARNMELKLAFAVVFIIIFASIEKFNVKLPIQMTVTMTTIVIKMYVFISHAPQMMIVANTLAVTAIKPHVFLTITILTSLNDLFPKLWLPSISRPSIQSTSHY